MAIKPVSAVEMPKGYTLSIVSQMNDDILSEIIGNGTKVYVQPGIYAMSTRKINALIKIAELQKYYQCNPVKFINDFFNIELLDAQAWIVQRSWNCPNVLVVATRGLGKSTVISLILMAKGMLFSNFWSYIASGSGSQAEQTFTTLERLANDNIDEMVGSTGYIFKQEVAINDTKGDGFSHSSNGFTYNLYNGSKTLTLNSNIDKKRGMRGTVVFDESGFLSAEMMNVYRAFTIVSKSFKTGKDNSGKSLDPVRLRTFPTNIPNQAFYISSASSTDTEFYRLYRVFAKRQLMGDPDYFVAHIDCEVAFHPTLHGKTIAPLLMESTVKSEMETNPEKARREYYCEFTHDAGLDAIVKRGDITRNSVPTVPLLQNDGQRKFVIAYDPARSRDNSAIVVMEIYPYKNSYRGRIVNCINLLDVGKKQRTPMQTQQQIEYLRELVLDYNGNAPDYDNILAVMIDAGSGGAGVNIADFLMEDWVDKQGKKHHGLIDKEYSADYVKKYPKAINKLRMMSPRLYKSAMYEAMIEMVKQDCIEFPSEYDGKGYITLFERDDRVYNATIAKVKAKFKNEDVTERQLQDEIDKALDATNCVTQRMIKLSFWEEVALRNIDAMKEEMVNMVRKKRSGDSDAFELSPEKQRKLHDDRSYCMAMCGWYLSECRLEKIRNRPLREAVNIDMFAMTKAKPVGKMFG